MLDDVLFVLGAASITYGVYQLHPALAWIVAGVFTVILACMRARALARQETECQDS